MDFKFELGVKVRDRITDYEGVIICRTQWLTNCNTYGVKSKTLQEGKPIDAVYFDEPNLIVIEKQKLRAKQDTGGPTPAVKPTNR